jgi:hypothetical protein
MMGVNKGHAVDDVTKDDPPVNLMYTTALPSDLRATYSAQDLDAGLGNPYFNPRHGNAFCHAYSKAFGDGNRCAVQYNVDPKGVYYLLRT